MHEHEIAATFTEKLKNLGNETYRSSFREKSFRVGVKKTRDDRVLEPHNFLLGIIYINYFEN